MQEQWKHYIYNYSVSNCGRIRNDKTNRILSLNKIGKGYLGICVSLGSKNNNKMIRVHRAVAELFIPNPNNLPQVNHIDGNKENNVVSNLEWCDNKYNSIHAIKLGLTHIKTGEEKTNAKLNKDDIKFIRENYKPRDKKYGVRGLARKFDVHHETIRQVLKYETWK